MSSQLDELYAVMGLEPDPYGYAATASGPAIDDLIGPPDGILDIYPDGTPMDMASADVAAGPSRVSGVRGGVRGFLMRGDLHAFLLIILGAWMIKGFTED